MATLNSIMDRPSRKRTLMGYRSQYQAYAANSGEFALPPNADMPSFAATGTVNVASHAASSVLAVIGAIRRLAVALIGRRHGISAATYYHRSMTETARERSRVNRRRRSG